MTILLLSHILLIFVLVYVFYNGIKKAIYVRRIPNIDNKPPAFRPPNPKLVVRNRLKNSLLETALFCLENEMDQNEVLKMFIEEIPKFLKADSWSFLLTPKDEKWKFLFWAKEIDFLPLEEIAESLKKDGKNIYQVIDSKELLYIKNVEKTRLWSDKNYITVTWLGVPIKMEDEIIGILNLDWFKKKRLSKMEKELVKSLIEDMERILKTVFSLNELFLNSNVDILTGAYNRKALEKYISKNESPNKTKMVLFIDIDNFKQVNDNFGHAIGDEVLKVIVKRIKNVISSEDLIFRYGGDEFVIIIEKIEKDLNMESIKQRVKLNVSNPIVIEDKSIITSLSLGYSLVPDETSDLKKAIELADKRMYKEKSL
ncbi:hypothetical protein PW5551_05690 [Petrotoga sp. 9PW.55.5.1]|uniref:sensor domain-containing diguanylate cyclase n=1 Tax=Petrotoga sp. 9PW.55.5.1 TaxID=1308979 RepID=UPI000DC45338|nr:sensor domain-containing diguanylate cyclase [Petrotoga sp. 9PW.55.5.1]RAO99124.1 hypothetical protein PW5551_05690 [Petrotoga sp. 9PW.55.5.1]